VEPSSANVKNFGQCFGGLEEEEESRSSQVLDRRLGLGQSKVSMFYVTLL
jgi:hypothetical protein